MGSTEDGTMDGYGTNRWSERLKYWELASGTNACIWSTEAAVSSTPLLCVPCLVLYLFQGVVFEPRTWHVSMSLNWKFTHVVAGLEDPCFNSRQSLERT